MSLRVLLFDMDDVLLHPGGYQRGLIETVAWAGRSLGFREAPLSNEDIAHFEAAGSTSEWDTAAMCAGLLLLAAWEIDPALRLPTTAHSAPALAHELPAPDFRRFAQALAKAALPQVSPWERAERLLVPMAETHSVDHQEILRSTLRHAREFEGSVTFRIFQELVLGSHAYAGAYGGAPALDVQGYLTSEDHPALESSELRALHAWLAAPDHTAAIFTNRPCLSPDGNAGTPEAEIGSRVAGLQGVPIVGMGALAWLSASVGAAPEAYLKPSPVHALAALQAALGTPLELALHRALGLAGGGQPDGWQALHGARVAAFEDAAKGLHSAREAQALLAESGVAIDLQLYGITRSAPKRAALEMAGAKLYQDLSQALRSESALSFSVE